MKPVRLLMMVLALLLVCGFPAAYAVSLSFETASTDLAVGDVFSVDLVISGDELLGYYDDGSGGNDLSAFDVIVNYSSLLLSFSNYALGSQLGTIINPDPFTTTDPWADAEDWSSGDIGNGQIHISELSTFADLSLQSDSFTIASLSFSVLSTGSDSLFITEGIDPYTPLLGDYLADRFSQISTNTLILDSTDNPTNPVPEPATMVLFATGLIGLGAVMKRRRG